jgi:gas vesicle protein
VLCCIAAKVERLASDAFQHYLDRRLMMADNTAQFANQAQDVTRPMYEAIQGIAETQINIFQKLAGVSVTQYNQAIEAAKDQLQLISRVRDPREFASAQADLVKNHGQRYVDSVKEGVDIVVEAWQQYGDRLEQSASTGMDRTQQAASSKKS